MLAPGQIGPYRIIAPIGRGGMGVVYRAQHTSSKQAVAIKTVRAASEGHFVGIRREIRALARIRHPGVVQILDEGLHEGLPWYAMQLLRGATLRDRQPERVRTEIEPETLREVLTIFRRLCLALAHVHGEGLVHCDLKPENILLVDDRPVLVDFGLMSRFGGPLSRDVLDVEPFMGTAEYMAPEQWKRRPVDGRTDLYAVGCILFETLTGVPPFAGKRTTLSRLHLATPPPRLSERLDGIPTGLDTLLSRLLAKAPAERIGHADTVAYALESLGAEPTPAETPATPQLFKPGMIGREEPITEIAGLLSSEEQRCAVVLVGGESGVGKTRLATEAARNAKRGRVDIITGECSFMGGTHPLANLLQTVADRCRAEPQKVAKLIGDRAAILAKIEPELSHWAEENPAEAGFDPETQRARTLDALTATLEALAAENLTLLVLDDLQWADEVTLDLLERLPARGPSLLQLGVLATFRADEVTPRLGELLRSQTGVQIHLGRLGKEAVEQMVKEMLGTAAPGSFVSFLAEQSEGNPFFVGEYLRAAIGEGLLARTATGDWTVREGPELSLPRSLRELVGHRIEKLSDAARQLLEAAAVIGRESTLELSAAAAMLDSESADTAIEELLKRRVVEEAAEGLARISHDKIREVAYERTSVERRKELHGRAARLLAEHGASDAVLAQHYEEANERRPAAEHRERAADAAFAAGAHEQAAAHLERALELAEGEAFDRLRRARWYRRIGESRLAEGDLVASSDAACSALDVLRCERPLSRADWILALIGQLGRQLFHRVVPSRWVIDRGREADLIEATLASGTLSRVAFFQNDPLRIVAAAFWSVNLAERAGHFVQAARNYSGLGWVFGVAGLHGVANTYFGRAREVAVQTDDMPGLVFALTSEAVYRIGRCEWQQANDALEMARSGCERTQSKSDLELVETLLGHPAYFSGDFTGALARHEGVLISARRRGHRQHQAWSLYCMARCFLQLGEIDEALPLLDEAKGLLATMTDHLSEIATYGLLASASARAGNINAAVEAARLVEARTAKSPPTVFLVLHGLEGAVEAHLAANDASGSRAALKRLERFARAFPVGQDAATLWGQRVRHGA